MKNKRLKEAIVILMVVLLFPSCTGKAGAQTGGGKTINSANELKEYLDKQPANSPDKPIKIAMKANDAMLKNIGTVIKEAGKYVSLDLSGSPLTKILYGAFEGCTPLVGIIIPNSVTSIGQSAFSGCERLTSVTIPNSVTSIGNYAFSGCERLTSVTIPASVTSIGEGAFWGCDLASITIPDSVTSIGDSAFMWTFPTSVTFQGAIPSSGFNVNNGDLRTKHLAGGIGTYTTTAPVSYDSKWTKQ
jgi:hypothetical protein